VVFFFLEVFSILWYSRFLLMTGGKSLQTILHRRFLPFGLGNGFLDGTDNEIFHLQTKIRRERFIFR